MALPPSIPTSFVPRPAAAGGAGQKFKTDYTGAFGFFAYGVLAVVFLVALGVFGYGIVLTGSKEAKDAQLAQAEKEIKPETAAENVRLKNRLTTGKTLLDSHLAFSEFFTVLGNLLPNTVRFNSLSVGADSGGALAVNGAGTARSFNALAVASTALSSDGRIKDIIFSDIEISTKDGSVSFTLTAELDPKLVTFSL